MLKKKLPPPLATVQDVKDIVNHAIATDVKKIVDHAIATDVKELIDHVVSTMNEMFNQQNARLDKTEFRLDKVEEKVNKIDEIMEKQDKQLEISLQLVEELKAMREEQATQTVHNMRTNDELENHESRIGFLEKNFAVA